MSEKRRLGRGLGALIPEANTGQSEVSEIDLAMIKPNPFQPRRVFDEELLAELAASIKEHGVLQAVLVTADEEQKGYYLVTGERRCRAARLAGLETVPAVVKEYSRKEMLEIALIENLQREDLTPVEEARAYRKLMQEYNYTQDELARRIGRSRSSVANSVRLLALPEAVLEALARGKLTPGQARPLLALTDPMEIEKAAELIAREGLTARQAEKLASKSGEKKGKERKVNEAEESRDPHQEELQLQMQRNLGTKVRIKSGKSGGTIEIYYYSEDDLDRLVNRLLPEGLLE